MAVFIPERLKELVESWILQSNRKLESGGMFFGTETEFKSFLPLPNFSQTPAREFDRGNAEYYEKEFSKFIGHPPIAGMHTHPSGSIPSEGDCKYIQHPNTPKMEVLVSDMGNKFEWFCFDEKLRHVNIFFKDIDLEKSVLSLAQSFSMMDLGRCMITPKHELLCENEKGKMFLQIDEDAYTVWKWLESKKDRWERKTRARIQKETGLSLSRVNKALERLGIKDL